MSSSTCAAGPPSEALAGPVADAIGDGVARLDEADAIGAGRVAGRFTRAAADSDGGTVATAAWKGRPAQDPDEPSAPEELAAAGPHSAAVCWTVTFPAAGGVPGP
jgi:hypothetical protein